MFLIVHNKNTVSALSCTQLTCVGDAHRLGNSECWKWTQSRHSTGRNLVASALLGCRRSAGLATQLGLNSLANCLCKTETGQRTSSRRD